MDYKKRKLRDGKQDAKNKKRKLHNNKQNAKKYYKHYTKT